MDELNMITKIADLEAEIIELENLVKENIHKENYQEKIIQYQQDITKLKSMKTKLENKLNKEYTIK